MEEGKSITPELKELFVKRSSIKGQFTKFKNYLESFDTNQQVSSIEINALSIKLSKFEDLLNKFYDLQDNIEVLNVGKLQTELNERDELESSFHSIIATAQSILAAQQKATTANASLNSSSSNSPCKHSNSMGFRLPLIQIHSFDGSYFKWLEFRDTFNSLIHNNDNIKTIHKYHYLISYLEGEASRVISNLEVTEANYQEAWKLLRERYENKKQLIKNHLTSLFNIEPIQRESEKSLRFLIDHVTKNLRALNSLGQPTDRWDTIIIFMVSSKLDSNTSLKWEECSNVLSELPTLEDFCSFLRNRANVLENVPKKDKNSKLVNINNNKSFSYKIRKSFITTAESEHSNSNMCAVCRGQHRIYDCPSFKSKSIQDRINLVLKLQLCLNCLRYGHDASRCRLGGCRLCKKRHNTMLHKPTDTCLNTNSQSILNDNIQSSANTSVAMAAISSTEIILSTALIQVTNPVTMITVTARALLDCGSQSSFITESLKFKLQLTSQPSAATNIVGLGNTSLSISAERCKLQLYSRYTEFKTSLSCFVLPYITDRIPKFSYNIDQLNLPTNLADPHFNQSAPIDMLIGADLFWDILGTERLNLGRSKPTLYNTMLGWIIAGPIQIPRKPSIQCNFTSNEQLDNQLTKFWEIEDLPNKPSLTNIQRECEAHFIKNTYRLRDGRFCVKLPFLSNPDCLGDSYNLAKKRFLNLEKRLHSNPALKQSYTNFIQEYAELGHLTKSAVARPDLAFFLPHHPVIKDKSESTKLRVVFDASARTSSGLSINEIQMIGPTIQDSLFNILIRFRQHKYVLSGDIEKMYRQVSMDESDRNFQLILWRDNEDDELETLQLNTITYGFASASFLSTRCLWQLGEECKDKAIKTIIQNDFYVDDLLTGADTEERLRYIQSEVSKTLSSGCFPLRKYRSNLPSILSSDTINSQDNLALSESTNTLGLGWQPDTDELYFLFSIKHHTPDSREYSVTKRSILSDTASIFDPLGLLSPCTILPKILIQNLWSQNRGWDESVPSDVKAGWNKFIDNLHYLQCIKIPRYVLHCNSPISMELHCFSDASQSAYGACIYTRTIDREGGVFVNLLCSKSKVAPLKSTTIPRLELCGALVGARLVSSVREALRCTVTRTVCWTDSSIVLGWLNTSSHKAKTFVANRISAITEICGTDTWRHVPTSDNPADLLSRGVDPNNIVNHNLWWHGPPFLLQGEPYWPTLENYNSSQLPEMKVYTAHCTPQTFIDFNRFSKFQTIKRVFAYVLRFVRNCSNPTDKFTGSLQLSELNISFSTLARFSQGESFYKELELIHKGKALSPSSVLLSLAPFIDNEGILRVGGRIGPSNYSFDKRHPILLSSSHHFTQLLFQHEHMRLLHAGPQLLLASIREYVWPIGGRELARRTARNCVRCRRQKGKVMSTIMGNLPPQRVEPDFPFKSVAVDFAGPFFITDRRGRGCKITKCYLCLFICLRYKCVHLEAVSELSKDAFILTLRRFIARRGKPSEIFSDNGRNFVAAAREIGEFISQHSEPLCDFASNEGIHFLFTPAYAPHFGGLWEAGIKSAKYHIKRILGTSHFTFEELSTLFAQVESILNSRPLCPLSPSPDDFSPLTPGHFLIGRPLQTLPSPNPDNFTASQLNRYERLEKIRHDFWKRWQKEYIAELQQRTKWRTQRGELREGDLVIIREPNLPTLCWRMGRIVKSYPGSDGVSRVFDVITSRGTTIRRSLNNLCPILKEIETRGFNGGEDVRAHALYTVI